MKTRLDVSLDFHSLEMMDVRIPIEIRDEEMRLIVRALSPATVDVESARYIVTATLPAGQSITRIVDAKGDSQRVVLQPRQDEQSPNEWRESAHYAASKRAQRAVKAAARGIRDTGPTPEWVPSSQKPAAWMRVFAGNVLAGFSVPQPQILTPGQANPDAAHLSVPPANELRFVQCLHVGRPAINIALPTSSRGCTVVVLREPDRYWLEVHPDNSTANILLGYAQNNLAQQEAITAEQLLFGKVEDPIAASIGAYSLLRFGEIDRLHYWTQNLMDWFLWLPDGAAIRGEHLARLGDHQSAAAAFLQTFDRGLPVFSDGVKFTYERMRAYADAESQIDAAIRDQTKQRLKRLKAFVSYIDFTKALTTFAGSNPLKPDTEPAQMPADGMDIAALFPA